MRTIKHQVEGKIRRLGPASLCLVLDKHCKEFLKLQPGTPVIIECSEGKMGLFIAVYRKSTYMDVKV